MIHMEIENDLRIDWKQINQTCFKIGGTLEGNPLKKTPLEGYPLKHIRAGKGYPP